MRGNSIKYLRVPEEVIDMVNEEDLERERTYALGWGLCVFWLGFAYYKHSDCKERGCVWNACVFLCW